jgi:hypothetical protein
MIRAKRDVELNHADPALSGINAETVYRDKKGKKLDMLNEFMRQQAVTDGKVCVVMFRLIICKYSSCKNICEYVGS